jgi:hypothetical protein
MFRGSSGAVVSEVAMTEALGYFFFIIAAVCGMFLGLGLLGSFIMYLPTLIREHARRNQR